MLRIDCYRFALLTQSWQLYRVAILLHDSQMPNCFNHKESNFLCKYVLVFSSSAWKNWNLTFSPRQEQKPKINRKEIYHLLLYILTFLQCSLISFDWVRKMEAIMSLSQYTVVNSLWAFCRSSWAAIVKENSQSYKFIQHKNASFSFSQLFAFFKIISMSQMQRRWIMLKVTAKWFATTNE